MTNNGSTKKFIINKNQPITIPQGFHDGGGKVDIDPVEKAKIVPGNILLGINILGVEGTSEPSTAVTASAKTATPKTIEQVIIPDENIDYLSQVTVAPIPYVESDNLVGGITVTIAG